MGIIQEIEAYFEELREKNDSSYFARQHSFVNLKKKLKTEHDINKLHEFIAGEIEEYRTTVPGGTERYAILLRKLVVALDNRLPEKIGIHVVALSGLSASAEDKIRASTQKYVGDFKKIKGLKDTECQPTKEQLELLGKLFCVLDSELVEGMDAKVVNTNNTGAVWQPIKKQSIVSLIFDLVRALKRYINQVSNDIGELRKKLQPQPDASTKLGEEVKKYISQRFFNFGQKVGVAINIPLALAKVNIASNLIGNLKEILESRGDEEQISWENNAISEAMLYLLMARDENIVAVDEAVGSRGDLGCLLSRHLAYFKTNYFQEYQFSFLKWQELQKLQKLQKYQGLQRPDMTVAEYAAVLKEWQDPAKNDQTKTPGNFLKK